MRRSVFVFGSNEAGRHGKGAAKAALDHHGAQYGVGEGRTGDAYALPTKDAHFQTRSWQDIRISLERLARAAREESHRVFVLTPVGCGLAGLAAADMAREISRLEWPENVVLHRSWLDHFDPPRPGAA